jgi:hypothetical protein
MGRGGIVVTTTGLGWVVVVVAGGRGALDVALACLTAFGAIGWAAPTLLGGSTAGVGGTVVAPTAKATRSATGMEGCAASGPIRPRLAASAPKDVTAMAIADAAKAAALLAVTPLLLGRSDDRFRREGAGSLIKARQRRP